MSTAVARRSSLPGFGLTMGLTLTWLSVIILIPLAGLFLKTLRTFARTVLGHRHQPPHAECAEDLVRPFVCRGLRQSGDGNHHRLGAGALSLSGPAAVRRHRRHSLCAADRGRGRRVDAIVRAEGLARRAAGRTRHQGRIHADRNFHCDGLHRYSVRGADGAAGADRSRSRNRGGGREPRRQPLAHGVPGDPAESDPGAA